MERLRTWTKLGAALLCVSTLACQMDDGSPILKWSEQVQVDGGANDAPDAGTGLEDESEPEGDASADTPDEKPAWQPTDAQIGKLLRVANEAEIDQARAALPKLSDPHVRAFAEHMTEAHEAAQTRQNALLQSLGIESIASVLSSNLEYEASGIVARLERAATGEIDRLYIDSQVTVHSKALDTLDEVMIPNVQNPDLHDELSITRSQVEAHLHEAQALAQALAGTAP